ncbi:MAG: response regulator [Verrucomicrobiota bacterium]
MNHTEIRPLSTAADALQPVSLPISAPVVASVGETAMPPLPVIDPTGESLMPILVADDDKDDVFFIQRLIKKTGVPNPIKTFDDGSEVVNYLGARLACATASKRMPALLFLDLRMRGLGGFGFLEWARQQQMLRSLTVVVLSNSNESADVQRALELGAHRYLVKYPCVKTVTSIVRSVYPFTLA